ncbi:hypothetical protein [Bradyrhizobium japonicum]|uniref:hypothetical protein n=1 Tax=Bradyrhizobium japonicum TaxID=375 RepID=UPI0012BB6CE6|nr:hypothetical protein [Bradyrhizobium japonicum]
MVENRNFEGDILRIGDDLLPDIDAQLDKLLKKGRSERVQILEGSEDPSAPPRKPYARSEVQITFNNERDLRQCVRLLRWSDERLRARPDQRILWDWQMTWREGMTIYFGVNWYNREFFEARKDAFLNPEHQSYYAMFGATADQFKIRHVISEGKRRKK